MKLEISLAPGGDLRVHLPDRRQRYLDIPATEAGLAYLISMMKQADAGVRDKKGYIGEFPTQAIVDIWAKQFKQRDLEAEAAARRDELQAKHGIDMNELDFDL